MTVSHIADAKQRGWQALAWAVLLSYFLFSGLKYSENILVAQAYGGWSPMDWVARQLLPDNFAADFPSGIAAYRMSSFMQLYVFAARLGIDLELLIPWVIHFEIVLLGIGAAFLFRTLAPKLPYVVMAIFALIVVEGSVRDMELARFGGGFYQGLYYNVADGLRFLGLAMLFRKQIFVAAVALGVSFTVHPVMAGMAGIFAVPYILAIGRRFSTRRWLGAGATFVLIAGGWFVFRFQSAEVASGGIAADSWTALVRMFSYHWYPVDIGVFARLHERYILPLLCLVSLAALYLPRVIQGHAERLGVIWGMVLLGGLACAGVLISEFSSQPFLIKLALHRASDMLIVVSLLIVVAGLSGEAFEGRLFESALGGALLLSPLMNTLVAFPLVPTLALIGLNACRARWDGENGRFLVALASMFMLLVTVSSYYVMGVPKPLAYVGDDLLWMVSGAFLVVWVLRWSWGKLGWGALVVAQSLMHTGLLIAVLVFCLAGVERKSVMPSGQKDLASAYLGVQRWAHANTPPDSLFMVDPTIYYGWRDFSQRSSFGNLREWLHTGWLYDSRAAVYEEGIRRFAEFGIDIAPYKQIRPSIEGYHRLSDDLRRAFYSKDSDWFEDLSRRYKINYVVFKKSFLVRNYRFREVFENSSFVVYRLGE